MKNFLKKSSALLLSLIIFISTTLLVSSATISKDNIQKMDCTEAANEIIVEAGKSVLKKSEKTKVNYSDTIRVFVTLKQRQFVQENIDNMNEEIEMLAKVIYREARGESKEYQAAVVWCVLNRVDSPRYGSTIKKVITSPNQFAWYPNTPIEEVHLKLATDVITRWLLEKQGCEKIGRTLPKDYFFFTGDGTHNYFRKDFNSTTYWDWSFKSPY